MGEIDHFAFPDSCSTDFIGGYSHFQAKVSLRETLA
jgi:hypothetical protein